MKSPGMTLLQYGCKPLDALGITASDLDFLDELQIQWMLDSEPLPAWALDSDQTFLSACGVAPLDKELL